MRHRERGTRDNQPGQHLSDLDQVLEALLAGGALPDEDQYELQPVADVLTALRQPAAPAELTGQASALAEFRARPHRTAAVTWGRRRGGLVRGPPLRPRPATALAAGVVVVAGLAAGAYEGDLPAPVQRLWHNTIGLTAVHSKAPRPPHHPGPATKADPSPTRSRDRRPGPAQTDPSQPGQHGQQHSQQHGDGHHAADQDGHHGDQPGHPKPSSPSGSGSSPSPSAPPTPEPSTSPAPQPSSQSSTSSGPQHPNRTPSSPP